MENGTQGTVLFFHKWVNLTKAVFVGIGSPCGLYRKAFLGMYIKIWRFTKDRDYKFDAFISYRHLEPDMTIAAELHKLLETFKIPDGLGDYS